MNQQPRPRASSALTLGVLALTVLAATSLSACRQAASGPDFTRRPTPAMPTLTAAAVKMPDIIATAVAAEPAHKVVQLETIYSDAGAPDISKVTVWVNEEGMRREEAASDSRYNPGVISVDNLDTLSRYNPTTKIFNRSPRGIINIVDQPPYTKNLLEKSLFGEINDDTVDGKPAIRLDGRPEDDPLRNDVPTDLTVWLDAESHRFIKSEKLVRPEIGPTYRVSTRVLAYDPPADAGRFILEPPADPEVQVLDTEANPMAPEQMSMAEARKVVKFPLLEVSDLPAEVKLLGVSVNKPESGTAIDPSVVQFYQRGEKEGYLTAEQYAADPPGSKRAVARRDLALKLGKAVKVGDFDGVFVDRLGSRYLVWQTAQTRIKITASRPDLDETALMEWAKKMR